MTDKPRLRELIALGRVEAQGDDLTRGLVESLREDRTQMAEEVSSLHGEVSELRGELIDAYRGNRRRRRYLMGQAAAAIILVSGLALVVLWYGGSWPLSVFQRGAEPAVHADGGMVVHTGPGFSFSPATITMTGPTELLTAVVAEFGVGPSSIVTTGGHRVSITYVDGPYTRISDEEQSVQATAIARHVWRLAERPPGTETISVRIERPMQVLGDYARANEYFFYPEQLKGPE